MADQIIWKFVHKVRRRIRGQVIRTTLCNAACVGLIVACGISFLSLRIPIYYAVVMEAAVLGCAVVAGIGLGIYRSPSLQQAALYMDRKGYQEKITTALYLRGKEDAFSTLQKEDAVHVIGTISVPKEFPVRISVKKACTFLGLVLLLLGSSMVDSQVRQTARDQHMVQQDKKKEIAKVEKVKKAIEQNEEISKTEAAKAIQELEQTKKELTKAESRRDLQLAKERYLKKMQQTARNTKDVALEKTLQKQADRTQKEQEKEKQELEQKAQQALEQAKDGSRKDKQEAYEQVREYAQSNGLSGLEKQIENYKSSNYSDADYVKAKATMTQAKTDRQQTAGQASASSDRSANRDQTAQGNKSTNGKQQASNGQGNGNQSNHSGAANSNSPGGGSGAATGSGWNRGSTVGREGDKKIAETVTIPGGTLGDDENLSGKANDNDQVQRSKADQANAVAGNKVDYGKVSAEYKQKAYKQVDGASYPTKLKNQIRNYFDGLN